MKNNRAYHPTVTDIPLKQKHRIPMELNLLRKTPPIDLSIECPQQQGLSVG
jgi:hypothetical protein